MVADLAKFTAKVLVVKIIIVIVEALLLASVIITKVKKTINIELS